MSEGIQCFSVRVCCLALGVGFFVAFSMRWTLCRPRRAAFPVPFFRPANCTLYCRVGMARERDLLIDLCPFLL